MIKRCILCNKLKFKWASGTTEVKVGQHDFYICKEHLTFATQDDYDAAVGDKNE